MLAAELILLDMVELELGVLKADLVGLRGEVCDLRLHVLRVRRGEEDVLDLVGQLVDVLRVHLLQLAQVLVFAEEDVRLVEDDALEA